MTNPRIFDLLGALDALKHLKRTGWVKCGVPEPETVACHMYRMAVLAMSLEIDGLDRDKLVRMALVHDIGEAIIGDFTPHCGVSDEEKFRLEDEAVSRIASFVPASIGAEWKALWMDYEQRSTLEAKVCYHLDKFDMIVQAFDYEKRYGIDLSQFFTSTANAFYLEPFMQWNVELREKRHDYLAAKSADNK